MLPSEFAEPALSKLIDKYTWRAIPAGRSQIVPRLKISSEILDSK